MFSYGSGSAASLYSLIGKVPTADDGTHHAEQFTLESIQRNSNVFDRLENQRTKCSVDVFNAALDMREQKYAKVTQIQNVECSFLDLV